MNGFPILGTISKDQPRLVTTGARDVAERFLRVVETTTGPITSEATRETVCIKQKIPRELVLRPLISLSVDRKIPRHEFMLE